MAKVYGRIPKHLKTYELRGQKNLEDRTVLTCFRGSRLVGGIGVGSGTPDQDKAVARTAISAIEFTDQFARG